MTEPRQHQTNDPQLSGLYREHALAEPTTAIDQRILAAARQAVVAPPQNRRSGWWQRWRMPLTLVTTIMLTASLALLVERQPKEFATPPEAEKKRAESKIEQPAQVSAPAAPAKQLQAPVAGTLAAPVQERAPKALAERREREQSPSANSVADQVATPPSPAGAASEATASGEMHEKRETRAAPALSAARPAATGSLAESLSKSRADNTRAPSVWLEEIRVLRSTGKREEAERQLREFRLAYPDYPLPEEFLQ